MADLKPTVVDESPLSDFVRQMKVLLAKRLEARGARNKADVTREMSALMQQCLGRDAWQAMVDAERETVHVPRDTSRDRVCHKRRVRAGRRERRYPEGFDPKMAQAGDRNDDE